MLNQYNKKMLNDKQKGERLEKIFQALHYKTKKDFAKALGIPEQRISALFEGSYKVKNVLASLALLGVNTKYVEYEDETEMFLPKMPAVNEPAQHYSLNIDSTVFVNDLLEIEVYDVPANGNQGSLVSFYDLPFSTKKLAVSMKLNPKTVKGMRVSGDSMKEAGAPHGSIVLYDTDPKLKPENGTMIVCMLNGVILVKNYYTENNQIQLRSSSKSIDPILPEIDDKFTYIGIVKVILNYPNV